MLFSKEAELDALIRGAPGAEVNQRREELLGQTGVGEIPLANVPESPLNSNSLSQACEVI